MTINELIRRCKKEKGFSPVKHAVYEKIYRYLDIKKAGYRGKYRLTEKQVEIVLSHLHRKSGRPKKK